MAAPGGDPIMAFEFDVPVPHLSVEAVGAAVLDAHVPPGKSVIVSLKAFAVELKNNCPSCIWLNVAGAVHSSVTLTELGVAPPKATAADDEVLE